MPNIPRFPGGSNGPFTRLTELLKHENLAHQCRNVKEYAGTPTYWTISFPSPRCLPDCEAGRRFNHGGGRGRQWDTRSAHSNFRTRFRPILIVELTGWGVFLPQFLTIPVVNNAVGGESARSYSDQGLFTNLINSAQKGDYVIIEFGHNDGSAGAIDNGKQDAVGDGYNITSIVTTSR